ncbi:hypothetical protein [Noviherbaspirillum aridicola]|uniref:Uncharacterized protein n=1 Tax=Noviherbaspirillum aridicola TaxID=2849687 RepID=A0ABQ4Q7D0_9BURK|nr:hypothetical protein [Noviherbaspirillum aridicola]GIZ52715.1 hypothetical protein NCCP691_27290 [Noviherbaspirillum aridicola]
MQNQGGDARTLPACQPVWVRLNPLVSRCARLSSAPGNSGESGQAIERCARLDCLFGFRPG